MPPDVLWPYGDAAATVVAGLGLVALVVAAGELRRRGLPGRATRGLVHAGTGLAVAAMPWAFASATGPVGLALAFALLNTWALRRGRLGGLHDAPPDGAELNGPAVDGVALNDDPGPDPAGGGARRSAGTVAFPLALVAGLAVVDPFAASDGARVVWAVAFAVLALADPVAAWAGRRWRGRAWTERRTGGGRSETGRADIGWAETGWTDIGRAGPGRRESSGKTMAGSGAFAVVAFALALALVRALTPWSGGEAVAFAAVAALVGAACERAGQGGWDNLWIALGLLALGRAWTPEPVLWTLPGALAGVSGPLAVDGRVHVGVALAAGALVAALSRRARVLTPDGALAAALLAATLVATGSWATALAGVVFFATSSALSKVGKARAAALDAVSEKGAVRDAGQVLANGGVAWACLLVAPDSALGLWGAVGAFAAAAADTWATEIGTLAAQTPRLVTSLRRVAPGTSGGVTLAGTLGAAAGSLAVGLAAGLAGAAGARGTGIGAAAPVALAAGLAGAFADSLLGATVQARYRRPDGRITERPTDAGRANARAGGWPRLTNDRVNLAGTLVGALVGWAMGA